MAISSPTNVVERLGRTIERIDTSIVDIPTRRPHGFANHTIQHQSYVLVRVLTQDGIVGIGEGATPGGPWWAGESVETIKAMIDSHLAPALLGMDVAHVEAMRECQRRLMPGNHFAKAAVEMAAFDAWGKSVGLPVIDLLGGRCRDQIPVTWALSAGEIDQVLDETERKLGEGHLRFKLKMGAVERDEDLARASAVMNIVGDRAALGVDPNGAWSESETTWFCRELAAIGVDSIEQPVPGWNKAAMCRLSRLSEVPLMADESLVSVRDAIELGSMAAAAIFSIKIPKSGGLLNALSMARIGQATGRRCFGGSTLETRIGTAASVALYCSRPDIEQCELIGPMLLSDDVASGGAAFANGSFSPPTEPGLGVELDEEKVTSYLR